MRGKGSSWVLIAALTALFTIAATALALADDISNNLDATVDATAEVMSLTVGGVNGTTNLYVTPRNGDGKNGCNLTGSTTLVVAVGSSATSVATVSPSSVTFTSCGDTPTLTVTPVSAGSTTISLSQTSNTTDGTFNLAPATFTVNVAPAPPSNTLPSVSISGAANGGIYAKGSEPAPMCDVADTEDGPSSFAATLSALSGPDAAGGIGSQTANCSYTDAGGLSASASITYSIVDGTAPDIGYVLSPGAPDGSNGWYKSDVRLTWIVSEPDSTSTLVKTGCVDQSITDDQAETTYTCSATSDGGSAGPVDVTIKRDATPPTITGTPDFGPNGDGWNNTAVAISYTCGDALSGLAGPCPPDDVFSTDGTHPWTQTVSDQAGNSATASGIVMIDQTKPTIAGSASPAANGNGWNNSDVTIHFECADTVGSGLKDCSADQVLGEGADQSVTGTATDFADNSQSATVSGINVDETPPTITFAGTTPASPNVNGWFNSDVTLEWSCTDGLSGVVTGTITQTLTGEGSGQSATGICTDLAGNTASDTRTGINIDETAPTITFVGRTPANGNGWNDGDVTVNWSCADAGSGAVLAAISQTVSTEGEDQSATGTCEDLAGNTASDTQDGINIDATAPTASASASPGPNGNGWNNTDVTVSFSGTDGLSGIDVCDADVVLGAAGAGQSASGTCTDKAGNVSAPATASDINIDKTNPDVALVGGPQDGQSYFFGFAPTAPTCDASDGLSGIDGSCTVAGYGTTVGSHTVMADADDEAGNHGSDSATYTVLSWTLKGFYAPVDKPTVMNVTKGGSTVPLKFEVFAGSTELTDTSIVKEFVTGMACSTGVPTDSIEEYATGNTSLRYDPTGGQFIFNWKTPKLPGTCWQVKMTTEDGSSISANFNLK
jgi:hypothetical protein